MKYVLALLLLSAQAWADPFTTRIQGNLLSGDSLCATGSVAIDSPTFVVDCDNDKVGIGTPDPSVALDVVGAGAFSTNLTVGALATASSATVTNQLLVGSGAAISTFTSTAINLDDGLALTLLGTISLPDDAIQVGDIGAGALPSDVIASSVAVAAVGVSQISATGSPSATTFLAGDGTWGTPTGTGDAVLAATQTWTGSNTFSNTASTQVFSGPVEFGAVAPATTTANYQYRENIIKAFGLLNGTGTPAWTTSFNFISTVTDNDVGIWTVYPATDFANANYVCVCSVADDGSTGATCSVYTKAAGSFQVTTRNGTTAARVDESQINVICVGTQ